MKYCHLEPEYSGKKKGGKNRGKTRKEKNITTHNDLRIPRSSLRMLVARHRVESRITCLFRKKETERKVGIQSANIRKV